MRPTFIMTSDTFYIGWGKDKNEQSHNYWQQMQFPYSIDLLTIIITDWLSNQKCEEFDLDGSNRKGFIVDVVQHNEQGIKDAYYGIIKVKAYNCFYAK